jgi:3-dehydroquinate synthase
MIKDADFFAELLRLSPALGQRDPAAMERLVRRCAELHLAHIAGSGDPFESGSARPLDFGHWSAHQLESMSHYRISHGHAVAVGIALDVFYAERLGWIPPGTADRTLRALRECGFDLAPTELFQTGGDGRPRILDGLEAFREHLGGELTLALPGPLGAVRELHEVNADWVTEHLARLRDGVCV